MRIAALATAFVLVSQYLPGQEAAQDLIRSTTRLVQVSVVVQKDGKPVPGLTKESFTIVDGGKPQQIAVFSENASSALPSHATPLPPNTFTNRLEQKPGAPSSITVVLLDSLNTKFVDQAYARDQLVRFLQQINPSDHIGVYALGSTLRVLHDYTSDSSELLRKLAVYKTGPKLPDMRGSEPAGALDNDALQLSNWIAGRGGSGMERDFYVSNRALGTLRALEFTANNLARVPGRKNLVWLSGGFPTTIGFDNVHEWSDPSRDHRTFGDDITRAVRALNDANIAVYPVDARGLMVDPQFSAQHRDINPRNNDFHIAPGSKNQATMEELATRTGGKAFYNTNDIKGAVRAAVSDSELTYTLGFYPSDEKYDGKFHDLKVKVNYPGAKLRFRKGYFDFPAQPQDDSARKAQLRDAVFSPLDATEIGLTAHLEKDPADPSAYKLLVNVEPHGISLEQKEGRWGGKVDVLIVQKDKQGRQYNGRDDTIDLNLLPANYQKIATEGLAHVSKVQRAPRATELRIIVRDSKSGAIGSITVPFSDIKSLGFVLRVSASRERLNRGIARVAKALVAAIRYVIRRDGGLLQQYKEWLLLIGHALHHPESTSFVQVKELTA